MLAAAAINAKIYTIKYKIVQGKLRQGVLKTKIAANKPKIVKHNRTITQLNQKITKING